MSDSEVCVTGNGSACVIGFQGAVIKSGTRLFTNSGCASMGYGLPAALGAGVARRDIANGRLKIDELSSGNDRPERVICLDGDGSLMMNLQELQTISELGLDFKLFIMNNNGYHSIRQTQNNLFGDGLVGVSKGNGVSFPPFDKLADTFGFKFYRIDRLEGIDDIINEALKEEGPVMVDVVVSDEQIFSPKLSSKVLPDGRIVSPPIDDMFPFLERDEYERAKSI